jgi:RHS repeat-associated protein
MMQEGTPTDTVRRYDYLPYGPELLAGGRTPELGYGLPGPRQRFTGKEQDAETGLDYFGARYFSGAQGRFASPDPHNEGAKPWEPQSWNAYSYAINNPLKYIDPDGEDYCLCIDGECRDVSDHEYNQWRKSRGSSVIVTPNGRILDRETEKQIGSATWFDGDAARRAESAVGLLNFFVATQTAEMAGGALGAGGAAILPRVIPPQIARNALKGGVAERMIEATLRLKGYKIIGRHVTAKTSKGVRYVDYVVERGGQYTAIEVKSGNAIRDAGQLAKDAAMETEGAVLGNNAGSLQGQVMKLKTVEMRTPF